ncbi:MAG TPA: hypothetical protein VJQ08_12705 [Candidatus Dormibacteraeota bacterium]|nr:hypothetical protein [Candidatus Dormibacteraeota bacterium]
MFRKARRPASQLFGALAGCLLVVACGSTTQPASSAGQALQQDASTRLAYAQLLTLDKKHRTDQPESQNNQDDRGEVEGQEGTCGVVSLGVSPASPQMGGVNVTLTGTANGCSTGLYAFLVRPAGGTWSMLQGFSTATTATWHTSGLAAGSYELDVWARRRSAEDVRLSPILTYTLHAPADPPFCKSVTWNSPTPSQPQAPGTMVTLSGTASGCSNPLYQFWIQPAGGAWTILQAYSTSSTKVWDTTGLLTGTYLFDIWVRSATSTAPWDTHLSPNPTYVLQTGSPCTSVTWNPPSPLDPQAPGAKVTLSGLAAGCPNPQYEFWIKSPNTAWVILQGYSSAASVVWNSGGAMTGTWLFDIWVKQLGSTANWEAHISPNPTYVLQFGPACTSSALSFTPPSPTAAGTLVMLTATSTGCPDPTYEFWVLAPTGSWTILQGYSTSSTATWSATTPGTYLFDAWVREAGNSPDWEAHISPNPTYTLS